MLDAWKAFLRDDEGQTLTEYALLVALVAVLMVATLKTFTGELDEAFDTLGTKVSGEASTAAK